MKVELATGLAIGMICSRYSLHYTTSLKKKSTVSTASAMGLTLEFVEPTKSVIVFRKISFAPVWGVRRLQEIPPLGKDTVPEKEHSLEIQRVPLSFISLIWMFPVALCTRGFCIPWGFRKLRPSDIENIPTSPTAGLAHGPGELSGTVELPEGQPPLRAHSVSALCILPLHRQRKARKW